jgi:hypothetical protein
VEALIGGLAVAVVGGVFAFATTYMNKCDKREEYYRAQVMPMMERMLDALEELADAFKEEQKKRGG